MDNQEIRGRIEELLGQYYEFFVCVDCGGNTIGKHRDREMAHKIMTDLYHLICATGNLEHSKTKKEG